MASVDIKAIPLREKCAFCICVCLVLQLLQCSSPWPQLTNHNLKLLQRKRSATVLLKCWVTLLNFMEVHYRTRCWLQGAISFSLSPTSLTEKHAHSPLGNKTHLWPCLWNKPSRTFCKNIWLSKTNQRLESQWNLRSKSKLIISKFDHETIAFFTDKLTF